MERILQILIVVFVVLKCLNVIPWPWVQVLIPLYIYLAWIVLGVAFMAFVWYKRLN